MGMENDQLRSLILYLLKKLLFLLLFINLHFTVSKSFLQKNYVSVV